MRIEFDRKVILAKIGFCFIPVLVLHFLFLRVDYFMLTMVPIYFLVFILLLSNVFCLIRSFKHSAYTLEKDSLIIHTYFFRRGNKVLYKNILLVTKDLIKFKEDSGRINRYRIICISSDDKNKLVHEINLKLNNFN